MRRFLHLSGLVLAVILTVAVVAHAQPQGDSPRSGRRGGAMMAMRFVPVEQVLGFLAFDPNVGLENDQLVKVRDALRDVHAKRADMLKELQGADDREAMMGKVRQLRSQMTQKLTAVLKPDQVEALKKYMQSMNARGGQRPGQRPDRQRGGQGGE